MPAFWFSGNPLPKKFCLRVTVDWLRGLSLMRSFVLVLFPILLILSACKSPLQAPGHTEEPLLQIKILPFSGVDPELVKGLRQDLAMETGLAIAVENNFMPLPASAFYKPRNRYTADSLLRFLDEHFVTNSKMLGITHQDIATQKNGHASWGVMGLGTCPGKSCVISTFRVKKGVKSRAHLRKRLLVLALHELGHTMGLPHCEGDCLMKDANGKMNLDNTATYCSSCKSSLLKKGFLLPKGSSVQ
jgi:archaemetzincin